MMNVSGLSMVGLAVMRLWVMEKVNVFDTGRIRLGYMSGSASTLVSKCHDVRALARLDLFPFLSPLSLYGLSYCMPELTSLISYCALS